MVVLKKSWQREGNATVSMKDKPSSRSTINQETKMSAPKIIDDPGRCFGKHVGCEFCRMN